jgi:hypothetical protein
MADYRIKKAALLGQLNFGWWFVLGVYWLGQFI